MNQIDFTKYKGLVPAVIQDNTTLEVLMVGFMNEESLQKTLSEGKVTFSADQRTDSGQKAKHQIITYLLKK